jgi:hypothetical protein
MDEAFKRLVLWNSDRGDQIRDAISDKLLAKCHFIYPWSQLTDQRYYA